MSANHEQAWNEFWVRDTRPSRGRKTGQDRPRKGSGCLPEGWRSIAEVQRKVWHGFAKRLDRSARVLDLATGDGRVMADLLQARRDLKPVGIDRATALPDPPRGAKVRGGLDMKSLPFPDNRFAAVTSQFGFEYGEIELVAAEIARLTRPGGLVALMCHRADGPIVAHNRARRKQIEWAIDDRDLPGVAARSLQLRQAGLAATPPAIAEAPAEGARLFGEQSAAWEIAEAVRRTLVAGRSQPPARVLDVLGEIAAQARNERARIASLEEAAAKMDPVEDVIAMLAETGLALHEREELFDGRFDGAFANLLVLRPAS